MDDIVYLDEYDSQKEAYKVAEMCVIGAILIKPEMISEVLDLSLKPEHFSIVLTSDLYKAILEVHSEGKIPDFVMVFKKMSAKYHFDDKEIKKFIVRCTQLVPAPSRAKDYAEAVINGYKARKLQSIGSKLRENVSSEDLNKLADNTMGEIYEVISLENKKNIESIGDIGSRVISTYRKPSDKFENRSYTGYTKLDEILKGMSAGNLIVLAARPKVGKTAFALSIAKNVASQGKTVVFYSLEMEKAEIYERLISNMALVPMNTIIDRKFDDKQRLSRIENTPLSDLPLEISDRPNISVNEIRGQCRMIKNLGLIVIDYLQLMKSTKKHDNRNQEIGYISRELKNLASELGAPILCLAQLNRVNDETKRPTPCDLRDSGEIEQNCNKLMLMWCVKKHLSELGSVQSKTIGVDVALNRRGNSGVVLMHFNGDYMSFKELEKKYEEPKSEVKWK